MSYTTPRTEADPDSSEADSEEELSFADMVMESSEQTDLSELYAENDDL